MQNAITDIPGIRIGHAEDLSALTGCTVILCPEGTVAGVDQRGGAPGTRETDALRPMHLVDQVHAVVLAGGSAFGLDAAGGVMRFLEERGIGYPTGPARVPIVPAAILYDLGLGAAHIRPNAVMGYQACLNASGDRPREGNAGAGTGAAVGKILGMDRAVKSGIGTASTEISDGLRVGALIAVNAVGDVVDPDSGLQIAGPRADGVFLDSMELLKSMAGKSVAGIQDGGNTVIGVVATNATLSKEAAGKVAQMAHNGLVPWGPDRITPAPLRWISRRSAHLRRTRSQRPWFGH
jgi:L-aminopeptidase/D-esterase-like protein